MMRDRIKAAWWILIGRCPIDRMDFYDWGGNALVVAHIVPTEDTLKVYLKFPRYSKESK